MGLFECFYSVARGLGAVTPSGDELGQAHKGMVFVFHDENFFLNSHYLSCKDLPEKVVSLVSRQGDVSGGRH
jgi:hypothetical protein